ncbi:hypothetical protein CYMTET_6502 [Cymbomonas tetramitiformis]|uniref:ADP-ribosylation factor-like protein 3 n=1 Tax=Cymbomonas tetramitiformis TaxID=36881 RepID=A0AAE0GWZ3_9CHLO|nr:hypothetical protein CYMTET_6502 [Cymbomonas tetramitiformis]
MTKQSQEDRCDVLVLGVQGCGKSLLVRRVLNIAQNSSGSSSEKLDFDVVATIGVELQRMVHKRGKILMREVGGGMLPIWAQHMRDWRMLIYVIDASDPSMAPNPWSV